MKRRNILFKELIEQKEAEREKLKADIAAADAHGQQLNTTMQALQTEIPAHNARVQQLVTDLQKCEGALEVLKPLAESDQAAKRTVKK